MCAIDEAMASRSVARTLWSKALDDGDSLNATAAANAPALVQNPLNVRGDWGPATYDVRNAGVMNVSYELPFGHGRQMLNSVSGWENNVVGGWILNSIVTIQSGFPVHTAVEL